MARFHPGVFSRRLFYPFGASGLVVAVLACAGVFVLSAMVCDSNGPPARGALGSLVTSAETGTDRTKVVVCHRDAETGTFKPLSIASPAVPAHLAHGDCLVDDGDPCTQDSCDSAVGCTHVRTARGPLQSSPIALSCNSEILVNV